MVAVRNRRGAHVGKTLIAPPTYPAVPQPLIQVRALDRPNEPAGSHV